MGTEHPRRRAVGRNLLAAAVVCLLPAGARSADVTAGVDDARAALEKWVETRRLISKERRDWVLGRELLQERSALMEREIESLRAKIAAATTTIAEKDKDRLELLQENDLLKEASGGLAATVLALEARTTELLKRLPEPLRERLKPLSQRIPADPQSTKQPLAERFQNVVGILNEVNKSNREITVTSEVRTLPDGTAAEVTAMYIGIGRAYYVSANGAVAGTGVSGPDGWVWTPADEAAGRIARAIAILKNEQVAGFVQLPMRIE